MKKFFIPIALFMSISAFGQIKWNQTYQQYFNQ